MFEGLRFNHWQTTLDDEGFLILTLNCKDASTNTLGQAVLQELIAIVERVDIAAPKALIICSGKPNGFIAGANIQEFEHYTQTNGTLDAILRGHRAFNALAKLRCPTVAAIHGACMGGGTELALACRYRVASDDSKTKIGLPEVLLGIHPGWGGTARLTRLVSATHALDLMLTGRSIQSKKAQSLGLIDRISQPQELINTAKAIALKQPKQSFWQRMITWNCNLWPIRQALAFIIRRQLAPKANPKHYPAPYAIVELWRRHGGSLASMLRAEPGSIVKLSTTPTARNLVRVFFLQEKLKNLDNTVTHGITHVHVIGAGVMGGDIAAWCALRGFNVSLQDRELKLIEPAMSRAHELFAKKLKLKTEQDEAKLRLITDVEGVCIAKADLVIEAIYENLEAKQALYTEIEKQLKPDAILATNTSSIPLIALREHLAHPQRFIGIHYFNPVALMPLVELVQHDQLAPAYLQRAQSFVRAIDKLPLPVLGTPGFLINRILMPYLLEAMSAHAEGIPAPVIDRVAKQFGMPMGPIELVDTIGLDVAASVGKILAPYLNLTIPPGLESRLSSGKRGKKDGEGFYIWREGKAQKPAIPSDYVIPKNLSDRLLLPLITQAFSCLRQGVVDQADLLDAGVIFGTGFAPFRGGPIQYVRETGIESIRERLQVLSNQYGDRFKPGDDLFLE